jgi:hypothetical protein
MYTTKALLILLASVILGTLGCTPAAESNSAATSNRTAAASPSKPNADGTIPSGSGTEKEKPSPGKGNVQGKALFNEKPAVGVEVKLCQTFSRFGTGCGGETFTTKTDDAGEYLFKDVPPGTYEGLTVKVFDTPYYVFATSGFVSAAKYVIEADKTYFAPDSHLFKSDLKVLSPKAGSKVAAEKIEVKWEPYQDAAYYKLSIHPDGDGDAASSMKYVGQRVEGESFVLESPLKPGSYRLTLDAFNQNDRKLAQAADDLKFTVTGP